MVLLQAPKRAEAKASPSLEPLAGATGVWLEGGAEARGIDAQGGSALGRELRRVLARGGVVGGTSAWAAALGGVRVAPGDLAETRRGLGLLPWGG